MRDSGSDKAADRCLDSGKPSCSAFSTDAADNAGTNKNARQAALSHRPPQALETEFITPISSLTLSEFGHDILRE